MKAPHLMVVVGGGGEGGGGKDIIEWDDSAAR